MGLAGRKAGYLSTEPVPTSWANIPDWVAKLSRAINNILNGKTNNIGTVTLTTGVTSTIVVDSRVGYNSVIILSPTTANAVAAISTTYVSTYGDGTFTITHASGASVDRTFKYTITG